MIGEPYNAMLRDLFVNTEHAGNFDGTAAVGFYEEQGIRIRLAANVMSGKLQGLRFLAWGCPHVIAACEHFCRDFEGRDSADLELFEIDPIMANLAVPVEKTGRILVLEDTVRSLRQAILDQT